MSEVGVVMERRRHSSQAKRQTAACSVCVADEQENASESKLRGKTFLSPSGYSEVNDSELRARSFLLL